jgi:4'-phosphopantetheinyl transferase
MTFDDRAREFAEITDCSDFSMPDRGAIDLWQGTLNLENSLLHGFFPLFSEEEQSRIARFLHERPRNRFIAARGILRRVLSLYRGVEPQDLRFVYGPHGKPELCDHPGGTKPPLSRERNRIHFNLSHSGERFVLAISLLAPVGVDIEEIHTTIDFMRIAERFFCPKEYQVLRSLPADRQKEAFYRCWTLKEAYVKARGEAMWDHMGRIEIPFLEKQVTISDPGEEGEESLWHLCEIQAGPDHRASLAVRGNPPSLRCFSYGLR